MDVCEKILQIQNRITYNLPRSMIGDIATSIDFIKSSPFVFQLLFAQQQIAQIATLS
ncbi:hypothetical protein D9M72_546820 [compost metagenome]